MIACLRHNSCAKWNIIVVSTRVQNTKLVKMKIIKTPRFPSACKLFEKGKSWLDFDNQDDASFFSFYSTLWKYFLRCTMIWYRTCCHLDMAQRCSMEHHFVVEHWKMSEWYYMLLQRQTKIFTRNAWFLSSLSFLLDTCVFFLQLNCPSYSLA